MFSIQVILLFVVLKSLEATNGDVFSFPTVANNDIVDFYYCETSFPFNAPPSIV